MRTDHVVGRSQEYNSIAPDRPRAYPAFPPIPASEGRHISHVERPPLTLTPSTTVAYEPRWQSAVGRDTGKRHPDLAYRGYSLATAVAEVAVQDLCQPRQMLPPSPDFHKPIGLFRLLHGGQQFLRLTMDTIHQLLVGIGDPVTLQDRFSSPAQDARLDGAKP
jgi:hypothetical protein